MKHIISLIAFLFFLQTGFKMAADTTLLMGYPFWFIAALIIAPYIAEWGSRPWSKLFLPGEYYDKPQPMYSIPAGLHQQNKLDEAMAGYKKIATDYPQEVKPWVEMIRIAYLEKKDADLARSLLKDGLEQLEKEEAREELLRMHGAITSMTHTPPTQSDRKVVSYPVKPTETGV